MKFRVMTIQVQNASNDFFLFFYQNNRTRVSADELSFIHAIFSLILSKNRFECSFVDFFFNDVKALGRNENRNSILYHKKQANFMRLR